MLAAGKKARRRAAGGSGRSAANPTRRMSPGAGTEKRHARSRCLEAFVVAVNQVSDMTQWYTTRRNLQLTCLQLCEACRAARSFCLIVHRDMPNSLLATADAPHPSAEGGVSSRVPRLRACRVTSWDLQSLDLLKNTNDTFADLEELYFGNSFKGRLDVRDWPSRLRKMEFRVGSRFNRPIVGVKWPSSLEQLTFGGRFNQPIEGVTWPTSLRKLTFLITFNQVIERVTWPRSLQQLVLGHSFNQSIERVRWPDSLQELTFQSDFNQPIGGVAWPASLLQLTFGGSFDQPIDGATWPPSLQHLTVGRDFNQPIDNVTWPTWLRQLTFGYAFNQPVDGVTWPTSLRQLKFGERFNQPIDKVTWPSLLEELTFDENFDQPIEGVAWPSSLRRFSLSGAFSSSLQNLGTAMPNLERFALQFRFHPTRYFLLRDVEWPARLTHLEVDKYANLEKVWIPPSVEVVHLIDNMW